MLVKYLNQAFVFRFQDLSDDINHHLSKLFLSMTYLSCHSNNPLKTKYTNLKLILNHLFKYLYISINVSTLSSYKMWNLLESNYKILIPFSSI